LTFPPQYAIIKKNKLVVTISITPQEEEEMDMNEKPKLSGVPETMLQTVYARAKETKTRGAIKDTKAVEIIDKINYDFSLADKDSAMHSGVVARTIVLDKLANKYLAKNKGAVVVNIACGLDTRCYRMNGYSHWYNLDLPETIAVREKLLPESGEISQIAMSAMDDWSGEITEHDAPAIVIIEGLTMYLSEKDVKEIFDVINKRFEHVTVLVETMSPTMVKRMKEKSIEGSKAKFTWGVKDGKELAKLLPNFRHIEDHSLVEGMAEFVPIFKLLKKIKPVSNISNKIVVMEK
jgi:O-methyltransferase involved in polyketide biosynthesis